MDILSGKRFKKLVYALSRMLYSPTDDETEFYATFDHLKKTHQIDDIPINISPQLCLALATMTTCVLCKKGSRRFYHLVLFLYRNILNESLDDIVLRFIRFAASLEDCGHPTTKTLRHVLLVLEHVKVIYNHHIATRQQLEKHESNKNTISFVKSIRLGVCQQSLVSVAMLLFRMMYENPACDVDWIILATNEAITIQNVKKYDETMRILPIIFAGTIRLCQTISHDDPFILYMLSIGCATICCINTLFDCTKSNDVSIEFLSRYDMVRSMSVYKSIDSFVNDLSDNRMIIKYIFRNVHIIRDLFKRLKIQTHLLSFQKPQPMITSMPNNILLNTTIYPFLFEGNIVFMQSFLPKMKHGSEFSFFCQLGLTIENNAKKGQTCFVYGPITKRTLSNSLHSIRMNIFINDMKNKYHMDGVSSIPFLRCVNIRPKPTVDSTSRTKYDYPQWSDFVLGSIQDGINIISMHQKNKVTQWLIASDFLDDYRLQPWNISIRDEMNKPYAYRMLNIRNGRIAYLDGDQEIPLRKIAFLGIIKRCPKYLYIIELIYTYLIYKNAFGVKTDNNMKDFIIVNRNGIPCMIIRPHSGFSQPRYPPYHFNRRINLNNDTQKVHYLPPLTRELKTFKQNELDHFFKFYQDDFLPFIKKIYDAMNDGNKIKLERIPSVLLKAILKRKTKMATHRKAFEYSINYLIGKDNDNFDILGSVTYATSIVLGLDPNVYGIDIIDCGYMLNELDVYDGEATVSIADKWIWSIVNKTSVLSSYDENEFTSSYVERPDNMIVHIGLDFAKGWIFRKNNFQKMIDRIDQWIQIASAELSHVSSPSFNDSAHSSYPKQHWLSTKYLPEVINAQIMLKKMYEKALTGDYWDFCEFHFGKYFIRLFINKICSAIRHADAMWQETRDVKIRRKTPRIRTDDTTRPQISSLEES